MGGEPVTDKEKILAACEKHYKIHSQSCSGFVLAVAGELGHRLAGNADGIIDQLESSWTKIDRAKAIEAAQAGVLIIVGLKSHEHNPPRGHGHVAVVVGGALYLGKYPLVWGGSSGRAQSAGTKSVGEVWRNTDRDGVRYYQPPMKPAQP